MANWSEFEAAEPVMAAGCDRDARRFEVVTLDFVNFATMAASLSLFEELGAPAMKRGPQPNPATETKVDARYI